MILVQTVTGNKEKACNGNISLGQVITGRVVVGGVKCTICGTAASWSTSDFIVAECKECGWAAENLMNKTCSSSDCKNALAQREHDNANNKVQCTTCKGTGKASKTVTCGECTNGSNDCNTCNGTGKVMHMACSGNGYTIENNNCGHEGANGPHYYCANHGKNVAQYH